jgi:hypothetical protein
LNGGALRSYAIPAALRDGFVAHSFVIPVTPSDLRAGDNTVQFVGNGLMVSNVSLMVAGSGGTSTPPTAAPTNTPPPSNTPVPATPVPATPVPPTPVPATPVPPTPAPGNTPPATPISQPPAPSPATRTVLVGNSTLRPGVDTNVAGQAEAFRFVASASGTAKTFSFFVDNSNSATTAVVGLYSDSGTGHPGTLIAQTGLSKLTKGTWNSVGFPARSIVAGKTYWLAIMAPRGAGTLAFRDVAQGGGGANETSAQRNLTSLPATWTTGTQYNNSPLSGYLSQ